MTQPTPYNRKTSFTQYSTEFPKVPQRGDKLDAEFDAIEKSMDQTQANLARIQRDDGKLRNQSVHPEALDQNTLALLNSGAWVLKGDWATDETYLPGNSVKFNNATYVCLTGHVSGPAFPDDEAFWQLVANAAVGNTLTYVDTFDGGQTEYVLAYAYASAEGVFVAVGGVMQRPNIDYSVSGTSLTFTAGDTPNGGNSVLVWAAGSQFAAILQAAQDAAAAASAAQGASETARDQSEAAAAQSVVAQGASETARDQSEASALASAASAQEAQDWVEMIGKYDVIRITSNYNLTAANLGNMIAVDASAGPVDVIVPSIAILGEPFHWRVKKIDVTTNQVRVVSPDKIDGFDDPYVITATNAGATFQTDNDVENNIVTSAFGASANVVSRPFFFTATEGQTTFTGPDDYGNTLAYAPGKLNQVVVDGDVIDTRGMTAADGISLVFHEPLVAGQQVFCEPFASFAVASTYSSGEIDSLLTRVQNGYIGEVTPMAGNTLPNGLLWCDGSEVSRTTYSDLFAYLGTTWGAGDGSTTFNLPDLREWFLRGASEAYPVGSEQLDQIKEHKVGLLTDRSKASITSTGTGNGASAGTGSATWGSNQLYGGDIGATETRPRNKAVRFAIKAFHPVRILTSGAEGVSKAGDLMTGPLRLAGDAVLGDEAVTKRQLDATATAATWELIESRPLAPLTPSVIFTDLGDYSEIMIGAYRVTASVNANRYVRVSTDNGSSWISTGYLRCGADGSVSAIQLTDTSSPNERSGTCIVSRFNTADAVKPIIGVPVMVTGGPVVAVEVPSAFNAVQVYPDAGTFSSGTVAIYGKKGAA